MAQSVVRREVDLGVVPDRALRVLLSPVAWLALGSGLAVALAIVYVLTHPHPAGEGGLYLTVIEEIARTGSIETIPRYTAGGVPFVYPPLLFYVYAAVVDATGVSPVTLALVVPPLLHALYTVPFYFAARELFDVEFAPETAHLCAGVATVLLAVTPATFFYQALADGLIATPAQLGVYAGYYTGLRLFRTHRRRYVVLSAVLFGVVLLTHPQTALLFAVSYLVFYAAVDRSPRGLAYGALVAAGGIVLAAPWWATVLAEHGPSAFENALLFQTTVGGDLLGKLQDVLHVSRGDVVRAPTTVWFATVLGGVYLLARRAVLLPAWAVVVFLTQKPTYFYQVEVLLVAAFFVGGLVPMLWRQAPTEGYWSYLAPGVVAALLLTTAAFGAGFAAQVEPAVEPEERAAMEWIEASAPPDATVMGVGRWATVEWLPYYTGRTLAHSAWGSEWLPPDEARQNWDVTASLYQCSYFGCVREQLDRLERPPDYLFVERAGFDVSTLPADGDWTVAHHNDAVVVLERTGDG